MPVRSMYNAGFEHPRPHNGSLRIFSASCIMNPIASSQKQKLPGRNLSGSTVRAHNAHMRSLALLLPCRKNLTLCWLQVRHQG